MDGRAPFDRKHIAPCRNKSGRTLYSLWNPGVRSELVSRVPDPS